MPGFNSGMEGILYVAKERFDSTEMVKTPSLLYVVDNGESFSLYLGEKPLKSDGGASYQPFGVVSRNYTGASGTYGNMEWVEEVHPEEEA